MVEDAAMEITAITLIAVFFINGFIQGLLVSVFSGLNIIIICDQFISLKKVYI
jgi:hypothetical protein